MSSSSSAPPISYSPTYNVYPTVNLSVSPDGRWLACRQKQSVAQPAALLLFDASTGKRSDLKPLAQVVSGELRWSGANRLVAGGVAAQVWKVSAQGKLVAVSVFGSLAAQPRFSGSAPMSARLVQFTTVSSLHQLGARLISRSKDGSEGLSTQLVELFSPANNRVVSQFLPPAFMPSARDGLQFSPSGAPRLLVTEVPSQFSVRFSLWEPRSGRRLWQQSLSGLDSHLDWTPDARFVVATQVTGSRGRDLFPLHETLVFDTKTGQKVRSLPTQSTVYAATVSGDTLITFGTEQRPEKHEHWTSLQATNWRNGVKVFHCWMPADTGQVRDIAASPRYNTVFGSQDGLLLWRIADLKRGIGTFKTVQSAYRERVAQEDTP